MLPRKILCPVDFSEPSYAALDEAITLAQHFGADLGLLHVVPYSPPPSTDLMTIVAVLPSDTERLNTALAQLREITAARVPADVKAHCEVKLGYADKEIACAVEDGNFDWLIISTHGLSGWKHLIFGSVAESIVRHVKCPVLTIHAPPEAPTLAELRGVQQEIGGGDEARVASRHCRSVRRDLRPRDGTSRLRRGHRRRKTRPRRAWRSHHGAVAGRI